MRTQEEINKQIEGLTLMKDSLPEYSYFGDINHEKISAQIAVLNGRNPDFYYEDEPAEEFDDGDIDTFNAALEAKDWLDKITDKDLFEL